LVASSGLSHGHRLREIPRFPRSNGTPFVFFCDEKASAAHNCLNRKQLLSAWVLSCVAVCVHSLAGEAPQCNAERLSRFVPPPLTTLRPGGYPMPAMLTPEQEVTAFPADLEIARQAHLRPIAELGRAIGVKDSEMELYGPHKAKIALHLLDRLADQTDGKLIAVTAITPTPLGEGKTVTAIGLGQAMHKLGLRVMNTCRQPSQGPTFGIKGGAAGGGYAQVVPMEDFNLHLTGDFHAVTAAQNLCAAMLDASLLHGNKLHLDPHSITWRRVLDTNDRVLRDIVVGLGGKAKTRSSPI
jgi:hypothetical protein